MAKLPKMKQKNKKSDFSVLVLGTLEASLLGNLVKVKVKIRAVEGVIVTSKRG